MNNTPYGSHINGGVATTGLATKLASSIRVALGYQ